MFGLYQVLMKPDNTGTKVICFGNQGIFFLFVTWEKNKRKRKKPPHKAEIFFWQGQKDSPFLRKSGVGSDSTLCCLHYRPVRILYSLPANTKKTSTQGGDFFLAGAEGFEPSTKVLETHVLPLHHAPIAFATAIVYWIRGRMSSSFYRRSRVKSYIMMPAATAAFRDSAPPRMGRRRRWVAVAFTASETPFPSLPIMRTKEAETSFRS